MRIISVDPGFERLGIAIIEKKERGKEELVYSECFKTSKSENFENRLLLIGKKVEEIISKYKPEILAVEKLFLGKNHKTAMLVSEAIGVIIYESIKAGLKVFEYTPLQVKNSVTGYGKGDKQSMIKMINTLMKIKKDIKYDDEYDAIGIGLAFFSYEKFS